MKSPELFGSHIGWCADEEARGVGRRFRLLDFAGRISHRVGGRQDPLCDAPVQHEGLAILAEHDVVRLDIAMDDAAAVGEGDGLAEVDENGQQAQLLDFLRRLRGGRRVVVILDRILERAATDEFHDVKGPALGIGPQLMEGHDTGVFEPARNLCFEQELILVSFPSLAHAFEGHLAANVLVFGQPDLSHAAAGVIALEKIAARLGRFGNGKVRLAHVRPLVRRWHACLGERARQIDRGARIIGAGFLACRLAGSERPAGRGQSALQPRRGAGVVIGGGLGCRHVAGLLGTRGRDRWKTAGRRRRDAVVDHARRRAIRNHQRHPRHR